MKSVEGFYWIRRHTPRGSDPEVAAWLQYGDDGEWALVDTDIRLADSSVTVLSERLTPPAT